LNRYSVRVANIDRDWIIGVSPKRDGIALEPLAKRLTVEGLDPHAPMIKTRIRALPQSQESAPETQVADLLFRLFRL
jgi:hypothetical protein